MKKSIFIILLLLLPLDWYLLYLFFINIAHIEAYYSAIISTICTVAFLIFLLYKYKKHKKTQISNPNTAKKAIKYQAATVYSPSPETSEVDAPSIYPNSFYCPEDHLEGDDYYVRIKLSSPDFFHSIFAKSILLKKIKKHVLKHRLTPEEITLWKQKRADFENIKTTSLFKSWKRAQFLAQGNKCAWCKKEIHPGTKNVEVDHIQPLYYGGENAYSNYVLSCHRCNNRKGKDTCGWGDDGYNGSDTENYKPTWIRNNTITGM